MLPEEELSNFELFRDCLATPLIEKSAVEPSKEKRRRRAAAGGRRGAKIVKPVVSERQERENDAEELGEFVDYIATETFVSLPAELRRLTFSEYTNTLALQERYTLPVTLSDAGNILLNLSPETTESLSTYGLLTATTTAEEFFLPVLNAYLTSLTTAPLPPSQTKDLASGCEICLRDWVPLTYHHLIPKFVHAKVLKRGWHTEDQLNNVAWLCRACHSFVHKIASHEELAREFYTVDLLMEREDVERFAQWVGKVRWKTR